MSSDVSFFGGQNILDGMPLRRAGAILFAIEGRTAQLKSQSRLALTVRLSEKTVAEKEQVFLQAIAQGRELHLQPEIQDIERFAPEWSSLVPADDRQRAALVKKLSEKFRFRYQDVPALRTALGLDTTGVKQAYEELFQLPIQSIYMDTLSFRERAHWLRARFTNRLERLPPFWTAYSLSLTETIGASILALPIVLAGLGPLPGVLLLFFFGLVNLFTLMGIVEAITRNGNMRYGTSYFGRLVDDYLGKGGSFFLVPTFLIINITYLIAIYIGISISVADITNISPLLWAAILFVITIFILRRESLNATVASALAIGLINILIIVILCLLALWEGRTENFQSITELPTGQLFSPELIALIFGVVLYAYAGHMSAANAAKIVLRRDPGGRSLIYGNMAAMMTIIVLYVFWQIAVSGVIPAPELRNLTGTVLPPLAEKIGGIVPILGIIYIVLGMGIGLVLTSYNLFYQVREMLPRSTKKTTQFIVALLPLILLFLVVEWMLFTGSQSFSALLGIPGTLLIPLLSGIFPILMLVASRRKGEYLPQYGFGFLGNPILVAFVYLIFLGNLFFHGLFIWVDPLQRILAIGVGIITLVFTFLVIRQGAFASRAVIEFKVDSTDDHEYATISMIDGGKPLVGELNLLYKNGSVEVRNGSDMLISAYKQLKKISMRIPVIASKEVKVWMHCLTPDGNSEPVTAALQIGNDVNSVVHLGVSRSSVIVPLSSEVFEIQIALT